MGDLKTLGKTGYDGNNLRNMNTLSGGSMEWMIEKNIDLGSLIPYSYPSASEFVKNNIQIIYLGWFLGDWGNINNGMHSTMNGLEIRDDHVKNTGDLMGVSSLDEDWVTQIK